MILLNFHGFSVYPDTADVISPGVKDDFLQFIFRLVFSRMNINIASCSPGIDDDGIELVSDLQLSYRQLKHATRTGCRQPECFLEADCRAWSAAVFRFDTGIDAIIQGFTGGDGMATGIKYRGAMATGNIGA